MRHKKGPEYGCSEDSCLMGKQGEMLDQDKTTETKHNPIMTGIESDTDVK
jgi:hypothetical protein